MRSTKRWKKLVAVEHVVFEGWDVEAEPGGGEVLVRFWALTRPAPGMMAPGVTAG